MGNTYMEARQINYRGGETKMSVEDALKQTSGEAAAIAALQTAVGNLQTGKTDLTVVAPAFSDAISYAIGALVTYQGKTYRCTTAHEGEWDATDFTETTISAEIATIQGDVSDLEGTKAAQMTIAPFFNAETAYDPGDIVYYNGLSYRCTNAHEGAWDASDFAATTVANELSSLMSGLIGLNSIIKTVNKQPDSPSENNIKRDILSIMSDAHAPYCVDVRYAGEDAVLVGVRMGENYVSAIVIRISNIYYYKYYGGEWTVTPLVN